jgi:hypothetical protein
MNAAKFYYFLYMVFIILNVPLFISVVYTFVISRVGRGRSYNCTNIDLGDRSITLKKQKQQSIAIT